MAFTTSTPEQESALRKLYDRSPDEYRKSVPYDKFRGSASQNNLMGCMMVKWCDMWIGIELDGYTHS